MKILDFLGRKTKKITENKSWVIIDDLISKLAFRELAFFIATSYIADTVSKCEFKVFKEGKEVIDELYYLLNVSPNQNENANYFKHKMVEKLLYEGETIIVQKNNRFYVADSYGIDEKSLSQNIFNTIAIGTETLKTDKKAMDVFHFKISDKKLSTLITAMSTSYEDVLNYAYETYKSSNAEKYVLEIDSMKSGDEEFEKEFNEHVKKQLETFMQNPKAIYPQFDGYKLNKIISSDAKSDSSDIRNIRKDMFEVVAEAFKMPISMLYGNMTNVKDIVNSYITFTIEPIADMISNEITRKTNTYEDWKNGNYGKVDLTSIYHTDIFDIADKVDKLISNGVYCVDEIRKKLGESELKTDFSHQHWITKNYSTSEDALNGELKGGDKQ